jgi:hypothetical protein
VQLGIAGNMTTAERALVSRATARYGSLIQVVTQPAGTALGKSLDCIATPGLYCYPPLRDGINIFRVDSHGHLLRGQCTGGFIARSRVDGKLYMLTAGHCAAEDGTGPWATAIPHSCFRASVAQGLAGTRHVSGRRPCHGGGCVRDSCQLE